ncbi:MAG: 2-oxoacid:acceptor oxidoreductase family protein [Bacillota bacterium]
MKCDVVIAGVGGQGNVLASRVLARAAVAAGLEVRTSENIGMAQREGPVASHVRMGKGLAGGIVPDGEADLLIGLELAEAVRALPKLRPGGKAVVSTTVIRPPSVLLGASTYDVDGLLGYLKERVPDAVLLEAEELAAAAGNRKAANSVLLGAAGALDGVLPVTADQLLDALLATLPPRLHEVNRRAFALGREAPGKAGKV